MQSALFWAVCVTADALPEVGGPLLPAAMVTCVERLASVSSPDAVSFAVIVIATPPAAVAAAVATPPALTLTVASSDDVNDSPEAASVCVDPSL
ncbi:MAG: hypothetical protein AMXMBFR37_12160 [Steroidobacteraceae bacterium]